MRELVQRMASAAVTFGHTRSIQLAMLAATAISLSSLSAIAASSLVGRQQSPVHAASSATAPPTLDMALLTAAQLFGQETAVAETPVAAPPPQLDWVLQGVFTGATPSGGSAIIMTGQQPARLYQADEHLPGGATLREVYPDRVVLALGDAVHTLRFPAVGATAGQRLSAVQSAALEAYSGSSGAAADSSEERRALVKKRLEMLRQRALGSS